VANPNNQSANVVLDVGLGSYHVVPQTLTLAPFSSGLPKSRRTRRSRPLGYAALTLHSSEPVVSQLATGTRNWFSLSSPVTPGDAFLVNDFTDVGFGAATVTNISSRPITVDVSSYLSSVVDRRARRRGDQVVGWPDPESLYDDSLVLEHAERDLSGVLVETLAGSDLDAATSPPGGVRGGALRRPVVLAAASSEPGAGMFEGDAAAGAPVRLPSRARTCRCDSTR